MHVPEVPHPVFDSYSLYIELSATYLSCDQLMYMCMCSVCVCCFPTAPGDYTAVSREVTLGADETVKEVEVSIQQGSVLEGVELFTAILSPVPGPVGVLIGEQGEATATIIDDDSELLMRNSTYIHAFY